MWISQNNIIDSDHSIGWLNWLVGRSVDWDRINRSASFSISIIVGGCKKWACSGTTGELTIAIEYQKQCEWRYCTKNMSKNKNKNSCRRRRWEISLITAIGYCIFNHVLVIYIFWFLYGFSQCSSGRSNERPQTSLI